MPPPEFRLPSGAANAALVVGDERPDEAPRKDYIALQMVPFRRRSASITDALDYEVAREQASALGRAGRRLEAALEALREHDRNGRTAVGTRQRLVAAAGEALWYFTIQRECCGLRDSRAVMRDYGVPQEVQNRMGIFGLPDRCRR
jgi:plasmid stabilization system protein ParE